MNSRKRHMTEKIEQPNQEKKSERSEKSTYKYSVILEADTTKQVEMKKKLKKNTSG